MDFDSPPSDPVIEFRRWLAEANHLALVNPNAMALATVDADGTPSIRTVLLKAFDAQGAVFFTNRMSRKGQALARHPRAAISFHWDNLARQVHIEGRVTLVSDALSDSYFATRPHQSRIGAWASDQSQPVANRAALDTCITHAEARFAGKDVPRPPHWGGYRVALDSIEFWQGDPFRLHDRIVYTPSLAVNPSESRWNITRLFP
ncbi:MAG: pyridoxamine 5'-phosphate oxidase [Phycisphaerales bacterium]|nr:pyridoxamine 5'-phosphate oxidase [Phycisphaerales bacterium]